MTSAATSPKSGGDGERAWWKIGVPIVAVLLLIGGFTAAVLLVNDDEAGAEEVFLEPVSTSGENPFMPAVGEDEPDVTPPEDEAGEPTDVGGEFTGDTAGLYGGSLDTRTCDKDKMVDFLDANPPLASAWAEVQGIEVSGIRAFVDDLTPLILRSDTAVTNHGFVDGRANPIPAVLQAGTAVLVDSRGQPVVKCYCGNPLTPPARRVAPTYTGTRWRTFSPTSITVIQQTTVVINTFVVIDIDTGEPFGRPAGTDGSQDGPAPDDPSDPPPTTAPPTTTTTEPDEGVPDQATYSGSVSANCGGAAQSGPITAVVAAGTITISGEGGSASGPISADGSFAVSSEGTTISGAVTADGISGSFSVDSCSGTVTATRDG